MMTTKKNKITIGILADVDAGKTTLSEAVLFKCGVTRSQGRVDHGNAFLDTHAQEKARGITIFSKQAVFSMGEKDFTLLDTPGHADFSAEMERTLQVLDYAVLVISASDGISGHVRTLWKLLERYEVPVFIFINKMDQTGADLDTAMSEICSGLDEGCCLFEKRDSSFYEKAALYDEDILDEFLNTGKISDDSLSYLTAARKIFPCYSGSALKMQGTDELLHGLETYCIMPEYPDEFGARVYKISRDEQGNRLTDIKITGGILKVRTSVNDEKINQIRIYNGSRFEAVDQAYAGTVCTVTGPDKTYCGQGLGYENDSAAPVLDTVLTYSVILPEGTDVHKAYRDFAALNEELPELHIMWNSEKKQVQVRMMGDMQKEILSELIKTRFGMDISFGTQTIMYRETIKNKVEGVGHFEPLRHYAEVHLILSPLEPGSGLVFESLCSEDVLDRNWQRLIMTHLTEKEHTGVLTGSPVTDMKISIAAGRAHIKHTEGGDFRQAVYRAVRNGLMKAESVLLEPYYDFRLEIPSGLLGRAMSDIERMAGTHEPPELRDGRAVLTGKAPVSTMSGYHTDVRSYTKGEGRLFCMPSGYFPCHNSEEVIAACGYDPESDTDNPSGSVFCSHGGSITVPWNEVENHMHIESCLKEKKNTRDSRGAVHVSHSYTDAELAEIFLKTYGVSKRDKERHRRNSRIIKSESCDKSAKKNVINNAAAEEVLLVDGYNMIFSWEELKEMSKLNLEASRDLLIEILHNYQGYCGKRIILVFDAYKQIGTPVKTEKIFDLEVVYTKEGQTADQYIEKYVLEHAKKQRITVATSDGLEQMMIFGQGALRMPARELREKVITANKELRDKFIGKKF